MREKGKECRHRRNLNGGALLKMFIGMGLPMTRMNLITAGGSGGGEAILDSSGEAILDSDGNPILDD